MHKLSIAVVAASLTLGLGSTAQSAVYTGTLSPIFGEYLTIGPYAFETRPLRVTFTADMTQAPNAYLSAGFDLYFEGTFDNGPGVPRDWYGDYIDYYENYSALLTPTGFTLQIDTPDNVYCSPYKPPANYCEHTYLSGFYLDGETLGGHVPYSYSITAVPEAATWAMMITGFGLAGAGLRRSRAQRQVPNQI
jgi:hypothetical protein